MCRKVPEIDAAAGMITYLTASRGIGGLMRQRPQDFIVDEVYADRSSPEGRYQLVRVTKTDMETHHLVRDLSRRLRISQRRISWAGTKDKRAVTTQRMSLDSVRVDAPLTFRNAFVEPVGRSDRPITLGDLDGNNFLVTIRAVGGSESDITRSVARVLDEMRGAHGVPNFFGIQRFGSIRPLNHLVGRALVEGDTERAVMTYLAKPFPDEPEDVKEVRQFISDTYEFKEALKQMPVRLRYERAMLSHLVTCPNDFDVALGALSMNLQKLFVHALQSYLFNKMLSSRIERGFPLDEAFDGDRVWVTDEGRLRTVVAKNLQEMNQSLAALTAIVQMPVPGYDTELSDGVIGQIERDVLAAEHLDLDAFKIESCPRLASKGIMRNVLLPADIQLSVSPDELNKHRAKVTMSFFLPKGGYATTILREVMKTRLL
jgi:tRNA pseudouridine13 synthase